MKTTRILTCLMTAALFAAWPAPAADAVQPQTVTGVRLLRDATTVALTTNVYFTQGASLLFSNVLCCADATGAVTQGLSQVTVDLAVGNSTTATWYSASVSSTNGGTFNATVILPAYESIYWQVRLTDVNTNVYYYGQQTLRASAHL